MGPLRAGGAELDGGQLAAALHGPAQAPVDPMAVEPAEAADVGRLLDDISSGLVALLLGPPESVDDGMQQHQQQPLLQLGGELVEDDVAGGGALWGSGEHVLPQPVALVDVQTLLLQHQPQRWAGTRNSPLLADELSNGIYMFDLEEEELADGGMQHQQHQPRQRAGDGLLHGPPLGDELVADSIAGGSPPLELGGEQQRAFDNDAFVDTVVELCRD